jgi:hypothetical protein
MKTNMTSLQQLQLLLSLQKREIGVLLSKS